MKFVKLSLRKFLKRKVDKPYSWLKAYVVGSLIGTIGTLCFGLLVGWLLSSVIGYVLSWLVTIFLIRTGRARPVIILGLVLVLLSFAKYDELITLLQKYDGLSYVVYSPLSQDGVPSLALKLSRIAESIKREIGTESARALAVVRSRDRNTFDKYKDSVKSSNITIEPHYVSSASKFGSEIRRRWVKYRNFDLFLCVSRGPCIDRELLLKLQQEKRITNSIAGYDHYLSGKRTLCAKLHKSMKFREDFKALYDAASCASMHFFRSLNDINTNATHWLLKGDSNWLPQVVQSEHLPDIFSRLKVGRRVQLETMPESPLKIDTKLFLMRAYVMVSSGNPLRAYIYRDGDVKYLYYMGGGKTQINEGTHQELSERLGEVVWKRVHENLKTKLAKILLLLEAVSRLGHRVSPVIQGCMYCYHQLAFDFMVDSDLQIHILEIHSQLFPPYRNGRLNTLWAQFESESLLLALKRVDSVNREFLTTLLYRLEHIMYNDFNEGYSTQKYRMNLRAHFSWLNRNYIAYLFVLKAELHNLENFEILYPIIQGDSLYATRQDWDSFLHSLGFSTGREKFDRLTYNLRSLYI